MRVAVAISTIGRADLSSLLDSLAHSHVLPVAVAIANQSGAALDIDESGYPFEVVVVPSRGGLSAGRNDAVAALPAGVDLIGFPNDDSTYPPNLLGEVARVADEHQADAVACTYVVADRPALPPDGTALDRRTVWLAGEPGLFVSVSALRAAGGFALDLGTGASTPWQSGEGTDVLLTMIRQDRQIVSASSLRVEGPGERRALDDTAFVRKTRGYARGTGAVYRRHGYGARDIARTLVGPWRRVRPRALTIRLAWARSLGRAEGLLGRTVGRR